VSFPEVKSMKERRNNEESLVCLSYRSRMMQGTRFCDAAFLRRDVIKSERFPGLLSSLFTSSTDFGNNELSGRNSSMGYKETLYSPTRIPEPVLRVLALAFLVASQTSERLASLFRRNCRSRYNQS
jgi:hypothetical protein